MDGFFFQRIIATKEEKKKQTYRDKLMCNYNHQLLSVDLSLYYKLCGETLYIEELWIYFSLFLFIFFLCFVKMNPIKI